jgi:hypothetical protein
MLVILFDLLGWNYVKYYKRFLVSGGNTLSVCKSNFILLLTTEGHVSEGGAVLKGVAERKTSPVLE